MMDEDGGIVLDREFVNPYSDEAAAKKYEDSPEPAQ